MDSLPLRASSRRLDDVPLPNHGMPRSASGARREGICGGCGKPIAPPQLVVEEVRADDPKRAVQFHVACFGFWEIESPLPSRNGEEAA